MTVIDIAGNSGSASANEGQEQHISAFKITKSAAVVLSARLRARVIWHQITAGVLMLAALGAIGGGIALIFYAGDLAKQQRSADVAVLIAHTNELSRTRDEVQKGFDNEIRMWRDLDAQLPAEQRRLKDVEEELVAEKDVAKRDLLNNSLRPLRRSVESLQSKIADRPTELERIAKARKEQLAPIDANIKELNEQIAGSSTVLEYNSILIRVAAVLLIVFLVQTFITVFRYITRLGAYYQARVDALQLAGDQDIAISDLQSLTSVLSPEAYDFGKAPSSPADQAIALARTLLASQKKEK